jgi:hypothetical protein
MSIKTNKELRMDLSDFIEQCMYQSTNGGTVINNSELRIGGKIIPPPPCKMTNTTIINNKIFVNGWEYMGDGKWRKTLRALWHKLF